MMVIKIETSFSKNISFIIFKNIYILISNGKIKHTAEGDIVSAIGGTYPLRVIEISKAPKGELSIDVLYFGTAVDAPAEYFGAIISCTSATEINS